MATLTAQRDLPEETVAAPAWTKWFFRRDAGGKDVRRDIEGMRAVAVLLVLLFHAGVPVPGGFVGVDVFFVISGFIITGSLVKELQSRDKISIVGFYARRAKRLLPATAAVMVVTVAMTLAFLPRTRWLSIGWDVVASSLYFENWRLAFTAVDYTAQDQAHSPLQHFWSLAVEEQFYLIWPSVILLVTLIPRRRAKRRHHQHVESSSPYSGWLMAGMLLIVGPSLAASVLYTQSDPAPAYFVTYTRLWELGIGGGLAIAAHWLVRTPKFIAVVLAWAGLAVVFWSAFVIKEGMPFPGTWALAPTLGTAAVVGFGVAAGRFGPGRLLGIQPMFWIGGMSYSLYLWHWPFLIVAPEVLGHPLTMAEGLVVTLGAAVIAWISLKTLENKLRFRKEYLVRPLAALQMGVFATLIGVLAGLGLVLAIWPPPPPVSKVQVTLDPGTGEADLSQDLLGAQVLRAKPLGDPAGRPKDSFETIIPSAEQAKTDSGQQCIARAKDVDPDPCFFGNGKSSVSMALIGDSHAAQWTDALDVIAQDRDWRLSVYTKQNCSFNSEIEVLYEGQAYSECTEWSKRVMAELKKDPPKMIVTSSVDRPIVQNGEAVPAAASREPMAAAFRKTWSQFVEEGIPVVVLADTPRPQMNVPECVAENMDTLRKCTFKKAGSTDPNTALQLAATSTKGVTFVDMNDAICPTPRCAAVIGGVLIYRDTNHMTATYSTTLGGHLNSRLPQTK